MLKKDPDLLKMSNFISKSQSMTDPESCYDKLIS